MEPLKSGDPVCPVSATHVLGLKQASGVVFRMEYITKMDQPLNEAIVSPTYIMKSAQARALAQNLIDAADGIDGIVRGAKEESLADILAGADFQIKN